MTKLLKEFWGKMNYPPEMLTTLLTPDPEGEPPEDYPDAEELAKQFSETQQKLFKSASGLFTKEDVDTQFAQYREKIISDVNKSLGLGYTRSQLSDVEWKGILAQAKAARDKAVEEATAATDETLKSKLHELGNEKIKILQEKEALEESIEAQVAAKTAALEAELNKESVDRLYHDIYDEFKWPEQSKHIYQSFIRNTIGSKYEIHRDGKLTQDGGKEAINFEGNGHYTHLKDAVKYLYESEGMDPKHKGGQGGRGAIFSGAASIEGELSENSKRMAERVLASRKQ